MEICRIKVYIQKDSLVSAFMDKMADWLKRWTVNPLGSAHVGSNPIFTHFNWFYVENDSNLQFEFRNPSSNLGKNWYLEYLSHNFLWKFRKKQNDLRNGYQQCDVLDCRLLYCIFSWKQLMTSWKITTKWFGPGLKRKPFEWLAHMITTTIRNPDRTK